MDSQARQEVIRSIPIFQGLSQPQVATLAQGLALRSFAPGEMIATLGDAPRGLYVLATGKAKLFRMTPEGREQTIYLLNPGEPFCLCSMFEADSCQAFVQALDKSLVAILPESSLQTVAAREPSLLLAMLMLMASRLKEAMDLIESLSLKDLPARLAMYLLRGGPEGGAGQAVDLGMTHRELAKLLGATPEALSRALRRLSEAGLVRVEGRSVNILDRAGLKGLVEP